MAAVVSAQAAAPHHGRLARIFGANPLTLEARAHYRGALGELLVGDALENLGPTWDVLHDLPLAHSVVDHLLIGRAGAFTVRAASFGRNDVTVDGSTITVGGERRDDIALAGAEATEVSKLLSDAAGKTVHVRPLLVVVAPLRLIVKTPAANVRVISSRELEGFITRAPHTLAGEEVALISDISDLATTWPTTHPGDLDTQQLHRDFGTIRTRVNDALVRRILWAAGATVVVYATVCSLVATLVTVVMRA